VKIKGVDEYGYARQLKGRIAAVHKPLVAASKCTEVGQHVFLQQGGGWMVHKGTEVAKKIDNLLSVEAKKPSHTMMPIYEENGVYNFYMKLGDGGSVSAVEEKHVDSMNRDELLMMVKKIQLASGGIRPPAKKE
jgi:hypothetical protein